MLREESTENSRHTAPGRLQRGVRNSLDQIEDLSSVTPGDPEITPIPLLISRLSVQFFTNGGVAP